MIIDSPIISGSYLSTGSLSQTGNVSITGSLTATAGISGSFSGSGADLFGIPASGITGLNLSQISSGSVSASISPNQGLLINTSVSASNFTGSFTGSLTGIATSASYASFALTSSYSLGGSGFPFSGSAVITGSLLVSGSQTLTGSLSTTGPITASSVLATGTITAQTLVVSTISSSVQYSSGSNIFGNSTANTQTFTGSINITGSAVNLKDGIFSGSGANLFGIPATGITGLNLSQISSGSVSASISPNFGLLINTSVSASNFTGSLFGTASFALDAATLTGTGSVGFATTASFTTLSSSFQQASSSQQQVSASYISLSGSYNTSSGSFSTRLTTVSSSQQDISASLLQVSASYIALSASYNTFSGSASTRITTISSSQQDISASQQQISASLLTISRSYASTGSNTFVGLETITGSLIVTGSVAISTLVTSSGVRYVIADQNGLLSAQTASAAIFTTQQVVSTAGQTTFPITNGYSTGYVTVFVNGTKLSADEYVDTSGTNIVFLTGSTAGDNVEFQKYLPAAGVSNNTLRSTNYFTATTGQTNFSVNYTPGLIDIFYNGAKLDNTEYTAANGTSITLATASAAGDRLEVDVYSYQVGAFSGIGGTGAANQLAYFNTSNSITGSNAFTVSGSAIIITGSLIVSGSGTLINIGPTVFSGSVTSTAGFSGSFSGNADSASLAQNSLLLQGTGSIGFATTASLLAVSSSQQQISASLLTLTASYTALSSSYTALSGSYNTFSGSASTRVTQIENTYATTGSNSFRANQSITGSLVVSSTITAQTLVVQTVTSSIVYSSGSNNFGNQLANTQTFTGSVNITGSTNITGQINLVSSTGFPTVGLLNRSSDTTLYMVSPSSGFTLTDSSLNTIYNATPTAHNWNIGNSLKMKLDASGSLGLGVTPTGKLHIALPTYSNEDTDSQQAIFGVASGYGVRIGYNETSNYGVINVLKPAIAWGYLILQSGGGNVLIGTTTNAGYKLDVNGTGRFSDNLTMTIASGTKSIGFGGNTIAAAANALIYSDTNYLVLNSKAGSALYLNFDNTNAASTINMFNGKFILASTGAATFSSSVSVNGTAIATSGILTVKTDTSSIGATTALGLLISNDGGIGKMAQIGFGYSESKSGAVIGGIITNGGGSTSSALFFATRDTTDGATAPTERMRITSGGNIGIGSTSPTQKVEIQAPANLWATRFIGANVVSQSYGFYVDAGTNATDTNAMFRSNGGSSVYFYIGGNGKVGVGTSSPDRLLTVNGDSNLLGNNYISTSKFFQWEGGAYWTTRVTSTGNQFEIYRGDTGASPFTITSTNLVQVSNTTQTDDLGLIQAYNPTVASTSAANAGLTVKSYNGTGQFMMWENYGMRIGSRIKTNTGAGGIYFTYGADTVGMAIASDGTILAGGASATGAYSFSLGNATANTYYQVRSANTNALYGADTRGTWIGNLSSKETYSNGGHFVPGVDNTVYCGSSSYRWAAVFAVNGAIQTSDQRLKTNIQTSDLGLDFITQLNPVSYKWIVGGSTVEYSSTEDENGKLTPTSVATPFAGRRTHYGLIAQQVKQVLGDKDFGGYVYDEETDTMSLRYDQFISPLIKAIQEQNVLIQELQEKLQRNNIN